jgi:hypothetical protein
MFFRKSSSPNRLADLEQSLRPQPHPNRPHQKQNAQKEHCPDKHGQRKCEAKAFDFNESISLEYDGDSFGASLSYEASEQPYADPATVASPWNNSGDAAVTSQSLGLEDTSTPLVTEAFHVESFGIAEPQSSYPAYLAAPVADVSKPEIPSPTLSAQSQWVEEAQGLAADIWGEPMPQAPSEYNQSLAMQQPIAEVKSMEVKLTTAQMPSAPTTPVIPVVETPVTHQTYTSPTYPTYAQEYPTTISVNAAIVPDSETDVPLESAQSLEDEVGYQYPMQQNQSTSFGNSTPSPVFYDPDEGEVITATAFEDRAADAEAFEADIRAILSGEKSYEPQVSPVTEATAPQPAAPPSTPNPTPAPAQTAPVSQATSHSIFDQMASVDANTLDVEALSLEQQFSEFDRILDREARPVPLQPTVVPQETYGSSNTDTQTHRLPHPVHAEALGSQVNSERLLSSQNPEEDLAIARKIVIRFLNENIIINRELKPELLEVVANAPVDFLKGDAWDKCLINQGKFLQSQLNQAKDTEGFTYTHNKARRERVIHMNLQYYTPAAIVHELFHALEHENMGKLDADIVEGMTEWLTLQATGLEKRTSKEKGIFYRFQSLLVIRGLYAQAFTPENIVQAYFLGEINENMQQKLKEAFKLYGYNQHDNPKRGLGQDPLIMTLNDLGWMPQSSNNPPPTSPTIPNPNNNNPPPTSPTIPNPKPAIPTPNNNPSSQGDDKSKEKTKKTIDPKQ